MRRKLDYAEFEDAVEAAMNKKLGRNDVWIYDYWNYDISIKGECPELERLCKKFHGSGDFVTTAIEFKYGRRSKKTHVYSIKEIADILGYKDLYVDPEKVVAVM
jgi:hypothetical protein